MDIPQQQITGLILAGGEGRRMGGLDKGLQWLDGEPLVVHVLRRLAPQVGRLLISANRHQDEYRRIAADMARSTGLAIDIVSDQFPGHAGPLAGIHAGLLQCQTPWLLSVPCDAPFLPPDLAAQLAAAVQASGARLAYAVAGTSASVREHPVFSLMRASLLDALTHSLQEGTRKVREWQAGVQAVAARFGDDQAFRNLNTASELADAHAGHDHGPAGRR